MMERSFSDISSLSPIRISFK